MSRGLLLSGALDASGRVLNVSGRAGNNASGLGDALESDLDDDDADEEGEQPGDVGAGAGVPDEEDAQGSGDEFLQEAMSEQTVVVDARSSLRASRSVGHLLQQQVAHPPSRACLPSEPSCVACDAHGAPTLDESGLAGGDRSARRCWDKRRSGPRLRLVAPQAQATPRALRKARATPRALLHVRVAPRRRPHPHHTSARFLLSAQRATGRSWRRRRWPRTRWVGTKQEVRAEGPAKT